MMREARLVTRSLIRSPGFTLPALLILAVGMTAATAIFTVVDSIVLRPLQFPDSDRLVILCEDHPRMRGYCIASPRVVDELRRSSTSFSEMGIARGWGFRLTDDQGARRARGGLIDAGALRAVGVQPELGRLFRDEEFGDEGRVALLSHSLWSDRYGSDPAIVGAPIQLAGEPYVVVGVLPTGFDLPFDLSGIEVWTPPHFGPLDPDVQGWRGFRAFARLAPGASLASADAEVTQGYARLRGILEDVDDSWGVRLDPLLREVVGDTRPVLMAFLAGAILLLVVVCANVANLLLARGFRRRRELAVRAALGAGRRQLIRQILLEGLLLAAVATGLSVLMADGATRALLSLAPPEIPRLAEVAVDGRILLAAGVTGLLATLVFAIVPALRVTSWNLGQAVRSGLRAGRSRDGGRLRAGLVVAELALSVVLLASAGLLTRSFTQYLDWEPGFERDRVLSVSANVDMAQYRTREQFMGQVRLVEERLSALPGVESVATASAGPLFGGNDGATAFMADGAESISDLPVTWWFDVGPGYFATLGVDVVAGREFTEADGPGVTPVAVVNRTLAEMAWPDGDPVGRVIHLPEREQSLTVVGVVADVPPLTPGEATLPEIYWSNRQFGRAATIFLVRTRDDPVLSAGPITSAMTEADPDLLVGTPRTLRSTEQRRLIRPRFQALVLLALAGAALALSALGVYAVVSYSVAGRIPEMGVRMALGAGRGQVVRLILRSGLPVVLGGIGLGAVGSLWVGRMLQGMAHGVGAVDPLSLGTAAGVLLLVAVIATLIPAVRASRADPLTVMRAE
jgi:predicted permease